MALSIDEPPLGRADRRDARRRLRRRRSSSSSAERRASARGRGLGWVVRQFALIGAVIVAGFVPPDWPARQPSALGGRTVLAVAGGAFAVWASRRSGAGLPRSRSRCPAGSLVETGPFASFGTPSTAAGSRSSPATRSTRASSRSPRPFALASCGLEGPRRGGSSSRSLPGLRRLPRARPLACSSTGCASSTSVLRRGSRRWPGPSRSSASPPSFARRAPRRGSRSSTSGTPTAADAARPPAAISLRSSSRWSFSATGRRSWRSSRATGAAISRRSGARPAPQTSRVARPDEVETTTGFPPGAVAPFPLTGRCRAC